MAKEEYSPLLQGNKKAKKKVVKMETKTVYAAAIESMIDIFILADDISRVRAKKNRAAESKQYERAVTFRQEEKNIDKQIDKRIKELKKLKLKM